MKHTVLREKASSDMAESTQPTQGAQVYKQQCGGATNWAPSRNSQLFSLPEEVNRYMNPHTSTSCTAVDYLGKKEVA